jgi:hypothetical protein
MATTRRPPGFGAPSRSRPLGNGARLRRDRSMLADAQRRYNSAASEDEVLKQPATSTADLSPPRAARAGGGERALRGENAPLTPLTEEARALYEGRVVPVREVARLCGVSVAGLYYHIRKHRWRRRRSAEPRDPAKSERQRRRYRELKALRATVPGGLKARDPDGQARALAAVSRAGALSGAALSRALARQDAEARARMLAMLTQALRDLALARDGGKAKRTRSKEREPRRRPYQWRPMYVTPRE